MVFGNLVSHNKSIRTLNFSSPGRWHASLVIKMALVKLIQEYDFRLEDNGKRVKWFWETFQMPYENTRVLMKRYRKPDYTAT